eukprot:scaffold1984_cov99-Cylindrotheca_fusiformis.AAC.2
MPSKNQTSQAVSNDDEEVASVETSVLSFLRRYTLGTRIDDRILDLMLSGGSAVSTGNTVGELLMRRPHTVKALLGARLVALSALAAERDVCGEVRQIDGTDSPMSDEVALTRKLLDGSNLCQQLESMVSFIVTHDGQTKVGSPGEQLVAMALQNPLIAQGVAIWAREVIKGTEFVSSGTYSTVAPSILSLVRVLYAKHHSLRDDSLEVAFGFLSHSKSNSDVSYQKLNEIKEQSLRLLLFLSIRGEGPTVLNRIKDVMSQSGGTSLDASLARYFASGLLDVARGPFSVPFVRSLAAFFIAPAIAEALRTSYFKETSKNRLGVLLDDFKRLEESKGSLMNAEDIALVRSFLATYSDMTLEK